MGNRPETQEARGLAMQWGVGECGECGATIVLGESPLGRRDELCASCAAAWAAAPLPDVRVVFPESAAVTAFALRRTRSAPADVEKRTAA